MKRIVCALVLLALVFTVFAGGAESAEPAEAEGAAVISFSSFSGGGYEYTVEAEDPSVLQCEIRYEFEPNAEELDGATYDCLVILKGTKAGSTGITVRGRSPILENEDYIYTAEVDEDLKVTLTPVKKISTFFVYRIGEIYYNSYRICMEENGYTVSVSDRKEKRFAAEDAEALMEVIEKYGIESWDGFSGSRKYVLDGEGFSLEIRFTDGTSVNARGDNAFPEHYFDAIGEIWEILEKY